MLRLSSLALPWLLIAMICGPARAFELRLWPLLDYESSADGWTLDLFGPLLSARVSTARVSVTVRPLASFSRSGERNELTVLYPLLTSTWTPRAARTRLLGFGVVERHHATPPEEWRDYVRLPPLLYYRAAPTRPTSVALFPLYVDLAGVLGQPRIRSIAFPLWLEIQTDSAGSTRTWVPFPLVSVSSGEASRGIDIWPLVGWRRGTKERSTYALWPMYISRTEITLDGHSEETLILGPLYWQSDSETRRTRRYLGFGQTVDSSSGDERWDFPWPFWHFDRGTGLERVSIAPLYVHSHTPTVSTGSILWPLYRWQTQTTGDERYARHEILLRLWSWTSRSETSGVSRRRHTLFPLFRYSARDASSELAVPAILDGLFPTSSDVQELYAPLWQVFGSTRRDERTRWKVLWGLLAGDGQGLQYPIAWHPGESDGGDGG